MTTVSARPTKGDAQWICAGCGKHWVVASLARECEAKHERGEW